MSYLLDLSFTLQGPDKIGQFDTADAMLYNRSVPNTPVVLNRLTGVDQPEADYDYRIDEITDGKNLNARCRVLIALPESFESGRIELDFPDDDAFQPFGTDLEPYINAASIEYLQASLGQFLPVPPPTVCRVTGSLFSGSGEPKAGSLLEFSATPAPVEDASGILVSNEPVQVFAGNDGSFYVDLVAGKDYYLTCDALGVYRTVVSVPLDTTVTLRDLLIPA